MLIEVNLNGERSPWSKAQIIKIIKLVLPPRWRVSVAVVKPSAIKQINQRYRQINKVTDILAFKYQAAEGELVICSPQVKRQAQQLKLSYKQEWARMLVHGALHLKGYCDDSERGALRMRRLEDKYLKYVSN